MNKFLYIGNINYKKIIYINQIKPLHYIYKITNIINNKMYIGKHSQTHNKYIDTYIGSGTLISKAIKKYGRKNFKKEILSYHNSSQEALKEEKKLITKEIIDDPNYYNMKTGGTGFSEKEYNPNTNNTYVYDTDGTIKRISIEEYKNSDYKHVLSGENSTLYGKVIVRDENGNKFIVPKDDENYKNGTYVFFLKGIKRSEEYKQSRSQYTAGEKNGMYGKHHSEETKEKLRKKVSINGIIYNSRQEAAHTLNMKHPALITKRCKSKSKTFKDWFYIVD